MTSKTKHSGGPKSDKGKAISSRNSTTHGLTSRHWQNSKEQDLYNENIVELVKDFDPQTHIERMLISKLAECTVRLMRIQQVENALFDLASSEAEHPDEVIKSLDHDNSDSKLIKAMQAASLGNLKYDPKAEEEKKNLINEIDSQNLSNVSGWGYIEKHMPIVKAYIIDKCTEENLDLYDFILREGVHSGPIRILLVSPGDPVLDDKPLTIEEIKKDITKIKSTDFQLYLENLSKTLDRDTRAQKILTNLEKRTQQVKEAAMPDPQKLGLIQRYRTADDRQFSKTLGELLELQKRRKII
ncbi:MAG: hypothetical protein NZ811_02945 [Gammaproteobacteria bacterium]|nr:hypothetical protein [Gammaproteobacteria bacterium]